MYKSEGPRGEGEKATPAAEQGTKVPQKEENVPAESASAEERAGIVPAESDGAAQKGAGKAGGARAVLRALRGFLLGEPCACIACGADVFARGAHFCARCKERFPFNAGAVCPKCGRAVAEEGGLCLECKAALPVYSYARSAYRYEGEAVRLIKAFKTGGRHLAGPIADDMAPLVSLFPQADLLLPVPMTASARRRRGYDQAALLARALSRRCGLPVAETVLQKVRETAVQKTLSRRERAKNLEGCFHVHERKRCRGKVILLVDDVMTTGATADACAKALYGAGAREVCLLTAAAVPFRQNGEGPQGSAPPAGP